MGKLTLSDLQVFWAESVKKYNELDSETYLGDRPSPLDERERRSVCHLYASMYILGKHGLLLEGWEEKLDWNIRNSNSEVETEGA